MHSFFPFISSQLNTSNGPGTVLGTSNSLKNLIHLCINSLIELRINDYVSGTLLRILRKGEDTDPPLSGE